MKDILTKEELHILQELDRGKKTRQVADTLDIPISFIKTVLNYIYLKLCVRNKQEAIQKFTVAFGNRG